VDGGGHAAQNLLLAGAAMGLGAVPIGAFDDAGVSRALTLSDNEIPLYLIPVGRGGVGRVGG
jgi:nitroreductase